MKKFKKIIAAVGLAAVTAASVISMGAFAADYKGRSTEESEKRFEVFGVINNGNRTFNDDDTLTRGKMAEVLGRIYGYSTSNAGISAEEVFADVTAETPSYNWILIAKNNFWVNGDGTAMFRPNDNITEIDGVKMLLTMAGYDWLAEKCGGYPEGYAKAAKILMLTEETGDLTAEPMKKDKLLKVLNAYLELYDVSVDDNGYVRLSGISDRAETTGKMMDGLRLKARNIEDPFK